MHLHLFECWLKVGKAIPEWESRLLSQQVCIWRPGNETQQSTFLLYTCSPLKKTKKLTLKRKFLCDQNQSLTRSIPLPRPQQKSLYVLTHIYQPHKIHLIFFSSRSPRKCRKCQKNTRSRHVKESENKYLNLSLYFCLFVWNPCSSFGVILLTNQLTHQQTSRWKHNHLVQYILNVQNIY